MTERVVWIEPTIVRGVTKWPKCEATNGSIGAPTHCALAAKIDYSGLRLCVRHAKIRALAQVLAASVVPEAAQELSRLRLIEAAALRVASSRRDGVVMDAGALDRLDAALETVIPELHDEEHQC